MGGYFSNRNFINTMLAVDIALDAHFANMLFNGDQTRILYSETEMALRERSSGERWSNANLPFLNHWLTDADSNVDRPWFNHHMNVAGVYIPELGKKIRYSPIMLQYDSTLYMPSFKDAQYAYSELMWDDSNETKIEPMIQIDGQDVKLIGLLGYNLAFNPDFGQRDWLEMNRITTVSLDFSVQTFLLKENSDISIPDTVLFNFVAGKGLETDNYDEAYQFALDHTHKTSTPL